MTRLRALLPFALASLSGALHAQAPLHCHWEAVRVRSGNHDNPTPVAGIVVWQQPILLPATVPWLRVYFSRAQLGRGSYVRITSLKDGDQQTLHAEHLEQWGDSTAYFNGDAVLLELVAGPDTRKNCLEIDKVLAGDDPRTVQVVQTICGTTDDRVPSANPAVGRLVGTYWCTGWITSVPIGLNERCHLSAGHCFGSAGDVLQFGVPASNANCVQGAVVFAAGGCPDFTVSDTIAIRIG